MTQFDVGQDDAKRTIIVSLNMARVKCLSRIAMLDGLPNRTDSIERDQENWTRAKDHIRAALSFLDQTRYENGDIQTELPFSD